MTLKQKAHQHYLQMVNEKISLLRQDLTGLRESGANETKSTAGDKHETALAMLQIEQANKREQLEKAVAQKTVIEKINPTIVAHVVVIGSLVKTDKGYLFVSAALGKAVVERTTFTALSPQSPLGNQVIGLKAGDTAVFNNNEYYIETIE
jgi:transcription elongation GreA/GreB family factor